MFRYKLRTLLIVLALGPPLLAIPSWRRAAEWERQVNCQNGCISPAIEEGTGCKAGSRTPAGSEVTTMLRFQIRDVLWLTALVALAVAWWIDHRGQSFRNSELATEIRFVKAMAELRRD